MPFDPNVFDVNVFATDTYVPVPDPPPIDLTQPVSLLTSLAGLLQLNLAPSTVSQLRSKGWTSDVTQITFQQPGLPLITYPTNAIKLKNEMLDFVFGYSTKRVSPFNSDPYTGFIAAPATANGILPPDGYLITVLKTGTQGTSNFIAWLVVKNDASGFLLYDVAKAGYLPYDLGMYGLPVFQLNPASGVDGYVNPYFSAIGRATSDLFPPTLSDGVAPVKQATIFSNVPASAPYQRNIPYFPFVPADWGGVHSGGAESGQFVANLSLTDYYGVPWTQIFSGSPGPLQYKVTIVGTVGQYLFNVADKGKSFYATYQYTAMFAPVLTGARVPVDPDDPPIDETSAGAPPNPTTFSWTYVDTSPNTVSSALADALTEDLPIVTPGSGYVLNQIFDIAGGSGSGYVAEISGDVPIKCKMWSPGSGYTNGTKVTFNTIYKAFATATFPIGTGTGLTVAATIIGASRNKSVVLANADGLKVWDHVSGSMKPSLSMANTGSGKAFLVPASKASSNPATGPLNLTFPMATVDADNPTLAATIRALGVDPTSKTNAGHPGNVVLGYSVEDNAFSLLAVSAISLGGCQQIPIPSTCVYNPFTFQGQQYWNNCYDCSFQWTVNSVIPLGGDPGAGQTGANSTAADGNICQSVSDLADAMLAAGADPLEVPALTNVLASVISDNFKIGTEAVKPQYVPTYLEFALMVEAVLNGGMRDLQTMVPQVQDALISISKRNLTALLNKTSVQQMFQTGFFVCNQQTYNAPGNLTSAPRTNVTIQPSGETVGLPTWSGPTPTAAQGFVNVPAGVLPLPIGPDTNPRNSFGYNILSPFWKYALPQGENIWWYYGYTNDQGVFKIDYGLMPIPVYVPNVSSPTPNPDLPPHGSFGAECSPTLGRPDFTTGVNCS